MRHKCIVRYHGKNFPVINPELNLQVNRALLPERKKKKKKTGNNNNKNLEAYLELLNCKDSVVAVIFILCNVFHVKKYISSWPLISPLQRSMSED